MKDAHGTFRTGSFLSRDLRREAADEYEGMRATAADDREVVGYAPREGSPEYLAAMRARVEELARRAEALGVRGSTVGKRGQEIERRAARDAALSLFARPIQTAPDLS